MGENRDTGIVSVVGSEPKCRPWGQEPSSTCWEPCGPLMGARACGESASGGCRGPAPAQMIQSRWILSQGRHETPSTHHQSWALLWPRHRRSWAGWPIAGLHNDAAVHATWGWMGPCRLLRAKPLMARSLQR